MAGETVLSCLLGRGDKWKLPWVMATTQMHPCYWDIRRQWCRLPIALSGERSSNPQARLAQPCPALGLPGPGPASCDTPHLTPTRPSLCFCGAFARGSVPALPAPAMGFGLAQDSSAGCSGVSHLVILGTPLPYSLCCQVSFFLTSAFILCIYWTECKL